MASGAGKTHLLYHLIAGTILPLSHGGQQACAVLLDLDGNFSVLRLAQQMLFEVADFRRRHREQQQQVPEPEQEEPSEATASHETSDYETIRTAMHHLHILHPQSLPATISQLRGLSSYLMSPSAHPSFERTVGLLALDSVSAFYWQTRAEAEDAALLAATTKTTTVTASSTPGYGELAAAIRDVQEEFRCPVVVTSRHIPGGSARFQKTHSEAPGNTAGGLPGGLASKLPTLPRIWLTSLPAIRLLVRRPPVRRVPVTVTKFGGVAEARRESDKRQVVVDRGRFECVLGVGMGIVEERALGRVRSLGKDGFTFWIGAEGVRLGNDRDDEVEDGVVKEGLD